MPSCIIAAACMQATVRLGGIHAVVFAGFSSDALRDRINDCGAKVVITMDSCFRGGKEVQLYDTVLKALSRNQCKTVQSLIVHKRTGRSPLEPLRNSLIHEIDFDQEYLNASEILSPEPMSSEAPLYLMYTSGSTGKAC